MSSATLGLGARASSAHLCTALALVLAVPDEFSQQPGVCNLVSGLRLSAAATGNTTSRSSFFISLVGVEAQAVQS